MFIEWSPRYGVGIDAMDDAHKKLIAIMNRLQEQAAAGDSKATLRGTLKELDAFTRRHFAEEEQLMESLRYPELATHQRIHADLLAKLAAHVQGFETGSGTLPAEVFSFIRTWLTGHLVGIDRKYGEHAHRSGQGRQPGV